MTHEQNHTILKAKMSFFHDAVGSRAHNEVFQVKSSQVASDLERMGYVERVNGAEMQESQKLQQEVGQRNALTNEAVSLANHVHNVQANQHTQQVQQARQQSSQQGQQQGQGMNEQNHVDSSNAPKATAKKADK